MASAIILIGPISAGKTTIATLLAEHLHVPHYCLDALRDAYYDEAGFDRQQATRIHQQEGFAGLYRYWKPVEIYALERVLIEHPDNCVIDLGGGHSVYENKILLQRAQQVLAPFPHVILLLPSPDLDESVQILKTRTGGFVSGDIDFDEHFVKHPSNVSLAKITIYTKGKTPQETCEELLQRLH